jgi:hypothetical protein
MENGQIISDLKNNCMLNISDNNKHASAQLDRYKTVKGLQLRPHYKILNRLITLIAIIAFVTLFLPWTQNISGKEL